MPKPNRESNSAARLYPRERAPPVTLDWIDGKNVKLLRVANGRETFRFKKLSQALSTIENIHKACWLREEKRLKQNLHRLVSVSPPCSSRTLFKRSSDVGSKVSMSRASGVELPLCVSGQGGGGGGGEEALSTPAGSQQSTALPSPQAGVKGETHPTLLQHDMQHCTAKQDTARTHAMWVSQAAQEGPPSITPSSTPFFWAPPPPYGSRIGTGGGGGGCRSGSSTSVKSSAISSSLASDAGIGSRGSGGAVGPEEESLMPSPSLLALLPAHLSPELHGLQEAVLGFPLLQKRVRELMVQARAMEQQRQERRSVALQPLEALRCRYLRLSESNISTLVDLCKESGIEVDIHPHMKDSDIDITTLFKDSPSAAPSTELL
ncbi:hypothetical protein ACEWY4_010469 [Coilia grayii]|uniref:Uncharacterized protein n=1 Tax=Coilia grayii TaxID=363190 RepID=A0ABD1K1Z5_9TELE